MHLHLPFIPRLCGADMPNGELVSFNNRMVLTFTTNRGSINTGFAARYRAVDF